MIEFLLGKTGGGKSYLAMRKTRDFLRDHEDGYVRTNLSINVGKLNAYMKKKYPNLEPDVVGRVHLLTDDQCRQFYLYREPGNELTAVTKDQEKNLVFPAFQEAAMKSRQILYIIDEAHIFFDSREWANVGPTLNFFASQHRKFRSDVIFVTQFLDQVEKRLRNHATEFSECINLGLRRMAFWRLPKAFRVRVTYKPPPCPSESNETYVIDKELADCYDTTAGVGAKGGFKPEYKKTKGLPLWTLGVGIAAILVLAFYGPEAMVRNFLFNTDEKITDVGKPQVGAPGAKPASVAVAGEPTGKSATHVPLAQAAAFEAPVPPPRTLAPMGQEAVRVAGYVVRGNKATITLTDGRIYTEKEKEFGGIDPRGTGAWISGEKVFMKPISPGRPKDPVPVQASEPTVEEPRPYSGEAIGIQPEKSESLFSPAKGQGRPNSMQPVPRRAQPARPGP